MKKMLIVAFIVAAAIGCGGKKQADTTPATEATETAPPTEATEAPVEGAEGGEGGEEAAPE